MRYQPYQDYTPCGHLWIQQLPSHWDFKQLKYLANCFPSNVDKKTKEGEQLVSLCNYTDVYYNEEITPELEFMRASATDEQVKKFALMKDDVIITKDSEDPNDIAVPTVVKENLEGVICGYHLSMVRANKENSGRFLKRVFDSKYARSVFATTCNGLTRYGLGSYAINNAFFPQPPLDEQSHIANFLDHETAKIDKLIDKQQQLIKLLQEKRQAVISHAVTKGLNPDVKMKDSGVEWLGEVPEHWRVSSLGYYARISTGATPDRSKQEYWDGDIPWIKTGEVRYDEILDSEEYVTAEGVKNSAVTISPPGTLLMAMYGQGITRGRVAILGIEATYNQACAAITANEKVWNQYLRYYFMAAYHAIRDGGNETSQMNLNADIVSKFKITLPSMCEQREIVKQLDAELIYFDRLNKKAEKAIELMKERRTALISAAVTGKIDVRNAA